MPVGNNWYRVTKQGWLKEIVQYKKAYCNLKNGGSSRHTEKVIFEQRLKGNVGFAMWLSNGIVFQSEKQSCLRSLNWEHTCFVWGTASKEALWPSKVSEEKSRTGWGHRATREQFIENTVCHGKNFGFRIKLGLLKSLSIRVA